MRARPLTIAVYIEGGGDGPAGRALLRKGFDALLCQQVEAARKQRLSLRLILCGTRNDTCELFLRADETIAILLVDSEAPLASSHAAGRVEHVRKQDGWDLSSVVAER